MNIYLCSYTRDRITHNSQPPPNFNLDLRAHTPDGRRQSSGRRAPYSTQSGRDSISEEDDDNDATKN